MAGLMLFVGGFIVFFVALKMVLPGKDDGPQDKKQ